MPPPTTYIHQKQYFRLRSESVDEQPQFEGQGGQESGESPSPTQENANRGHMALNWARSWSYQYNITCQSISDIIGLMSELGQRTFSSKPENQESMGPATQTALLTDELPKVDTAGPTQHNLDEVSRTLSSSLQSLRRRSLQHVPSTSSGLTLPPKNSGDLSVSSSPQAAAPPPQSFVQWILQLAQLKNPLASAGPASKPPAQPTVWREGSFGIPSRPWGPRSRRSSSLPPKPKPTLPKRRPRSRLPQEPNDGTAETSGPRSRRLSRSPPSSAAATVDRIRKSGRVYSRPPPTVEMKRVCPPGPPSVHPLVSGVANFDPKGTQGSTPLAVLDAGCGVALASAITNAGMTRDEFFSSNSTNPTGHRNPYYRRRAQAFGESTEPIPEERFDYPVIHGRDPTILDSGDTDGDDDLDSVTSSSHIEDIEQDPERDCDISTCDTNTNGDDDDDDVIWIPDITDDASSATESSSAVTTQSDANDDDQESITGGDEGNTRWSLNVGRQRSRRTEGAGSTASSDSGRAMRRRRRAIASTDNTLSSSPTTSVSEVSVYGNTTMADALGVPVRVDTSLGPFSSPLDSARQRLGPTGGPAMHGSRRAFYTEAADGSRAEVEDALVEMAPLQRVTSHSDNWY